MSLAATLPYDHPYAGGYPGIGSQPLPTDADAIDYLSRMATADGAGVEVGVATAVDAFFRDSKAAGVFDALKACCILCGARTITGALVPLAGDAPTAQGGWASGDYSRTDGLEGDGNALYLDSNRAGDDDPQNDCHLSVYVTQVSTLGSDQISNRISEVADGYRTISQNAQDGDTFFRCSSNNPGTIAGTPTGFLGASRNSASEFIARHSEANETVSVASIGPASTNVRVFNRISTDSFSDAKIAFYSIGSSLGSNPADGLADLDTAVTNLITAIGEAL